MALVAAFVVLLIANDPPGKRVKSQAPADSRFGSTTAVGSRDDPVPFNKAAPSGDWELKVTNLNRHVMVVSVAMLSDYAANGSTFIGPPAPKGYKYVGVEFRALFTGSGIGNPRRLGLTLVDGAGRTYDSTYISGGYGLDDPQLLSEQDGIVQGSSVDGYAYYLLPNEAANGHLLVLSQEGYEGDTYFAAG